MPPSSSEHERQRAERRARIRRSALRQIYLPMAAGLVVLILLSVLLWALPGDAGDNILIMILLLCPACISLLVVYLLLVALALGLVEGHRQGLRGLEVVNQLAHRARNITLEAAGKVNEASIRINSAAAPVSKAMHAVLSPEPEVDSEPTQTDGHHDNAKQP